MLTLKSSEEEFQRLKSEKEMNKSPRVRKRCFAIFMKLSELHESIYVPVSEMENHKAAIMKSPDSNPVHSINEASQRIEEFCGFARKPTQVRHFLIRHGYRCRKMAHIAGKAYFLKEDYCYCDKQCTLSALPHSYGRS